MMDRDVQAQLLQCDHCKHPYTGLRRSLIRRGFCSNACKQKAYRERKAKHSAAPLTGKFLNRLPLDMALVDY